MEVSDIPPSAKLGMSVDSSLEIPNVLNTNIAFAGLNEVTEPFHLTLTHDGQSWSVQQIH